MTNTDEQVEAQRKRLKDIKDAGLLFEKWVKKYLKTGDLKESQLRKNARGRYVGKTIFMDMVSSAEFTLSKKRVLFASLFTMDPETLFAFEPLYVTSRSSQFLNFLDEVAENLKNTKELYSLYGKAQQLYETNILTEDKLNYTREKLFNYKKKHGMYADLYIEVDAKRKYAEENRTGESQKSIITRVLESHILAEDHDELLKSYKNLGKSMIKLYENFKSAYANYKRNLP
jgi:hypothetical protein